MAEKVTAADLIARLSALNLEDSNHQRELQQLIEDASNALERAAINETQPGVETGEAIDSGARHGVPYVLVLLDGHSHRFSHNVSKEAAPLAAQKALKTLSYLLSFYLPSVGVNPSVCRIVIRIYAHFATLEDEYPPQEASVSGSVDDQRRWFGNFVADFNKSGPYRDFIDAGNRISVETKIGDMFRDSNEDPRCKHIMLGVWGRPTYLALLKDKSDKVTLIKGFIMGPDVETLTQGVKKTRFRLFENVTVWALPRPTLREEGDGHAKSNHWRDRPDGSLNVPETAEDNGGSTMKDVSEPEQSHPGEEHAGLFPVNKDGERIDPKMPDPTDEEVDAFHRTYYSGSGPKPCSNHHLGSGCHNTSCKFSHTPMSPSNLAVLRNLYKCRPCMSKGKCRRVNCYYGHVCQSRMCLVLGLQRESCPLKEFHDVDPKIAKWV
ncbi:hypothetical protein BDV95DRAFT_592592 [Massariosphaeria phaeospora]|uniref:C3H1-type domain-containing protein n=1 Tax=Massariosphaeria phaeospora TaxID=100035 RepID=A0A7C8MEC1_9PLEO|nr:hypothetical protein BDV95DRAFT_592592 [Massariosphaeria phaeospora]